MDLTKIVRNSIAIAIAAGTLYYAHNEIKKASDDLYNEGYKHGIQERKLNEDIKNMPKIELKEENKRIHYDKNEKIIYKKEIDRA